jgi:hypothetical protein
MGFRVLIAGPVTSPTTRPRATPDARVPVLPKIRALGVPAALVAQDGLEDMIDKIPWDSFDVLFIGGSTAFKLLHHEDALRAVARQRPEPVRRRKGPDRPRREPEPEVARPDLADPRARQGDPRRPRQLALPHGDRTCRRRGVGRRPYLAFGPDKNLPKIKAWIRTFTDGAEMADVIRAGRPLTADQQQLLDDLTGEKKSKRKPAAFAVTVPGDLFGALALRGAVGVRGLLGDLSAEELRAVAAFLVPAAGSGWSVAAPANRQRDRHTDAMPPNPVPDRRRRRVVVDGSSRRTARPGEARRPDRRATRRGVEEGRSEARSGRG